MSEVTVWSGEDIAALARAWATIHAAAFEPDGARAWSADEITALLQRDTTLAVYSARGFLIAETVGDEAEILTFAVDPDARGKGLGRRLLEKLIAECTCRSVNKYSLEVATDNRAAIALYLSSGFEKVGIRKNYFRRTTGFVSALVMQKCSRHNE